MTGVQYYIGVWGWRGTDEALDMWFGMSPHLREVWGSHVQRIRV